MSHHIIHYHYNVPYFSHQRNTYIYDEYETYTIDNEFISIFYDLPDSSLPITNVIV
jgi:hypothetical protein